MGSTKGDHPSWRLATITIQTIPKISCHQRAPLDATRRTSAVLNVVTTVVSPLYLRPHWRPKPYCFFSRCFRHARNSSKLLSDGARFPAAPVVALAPFCIAMSFSVASQYRFQPCTFAVRLTSFHLG